MTHPIYPCLWFDGQAKAAATFYCSLFENSKISSDNPMVVIFELNGKKIMGLNGGPMYKINPSISLFVRCKSILQTNELWNKLMDGGKAMMPMDKYPWSERYGWLQDKFGLTWQISISDRDDMKQEITPCMLFTGQQFGKAEDAIHFYSSIFENSETTMMIHYPKEDSHAGKVMYSEFKLNHYDLIAMDGPGAHDYSFNEGVSFVVNCETQAEIDFYWNKLTAGGQESKCGWLIDQFGVSWQIVPANIGTLMSNPEKSQRVMKEILQMRKLNIDKLINA